MLYKDILKLLGYYFVGAALAVLVPFLLAAYYQFIADPADHPQPHTTFDFLLTIAISLGFSMVCLFYGRGATGNLYRREGILSVVLIWFLTPAMAAIPYYTSGTLQDPLQAYFEAVSGFTTTGSTTMQAKAYDPNTGNEVPIIRTFCGSHTTVYSYYGTIKPVVDPKTGEILYEGVEAVSKALLFWRSMTQWLGGGGIMVLFVAILPLLGVGGKALMTVEVTGPIKDSMTPRVKETALQLWKIYSGLTVLQIGLLLVTNADLAWLDAIVITFSTISTGGFSIKNGSIGSYNNPTTEWVIMLFMILGSINFALYYHSLKGKFYRAYEPEFFLFLTIIILACSYTAWDIVGTENRTVSGDDLGVFSTSQAIRYGAFNVISVMTSTGFSSSNFDIWPYPSQVLMLIVMFIGGMSSSTAGGMKVMRLFMIFRIVQYKIESLFRPEAVRRFKVGERDVDLSAGMMVMCFFAVIIAIAVLSTFIYVMDGIDPESSLALVAQMVNNTGVGFRVVGPAESCAFLSDFALSYSCILMVFARLEYLAVLAILVPAFWRQTR